MKNLHLLLSILMCTSSLFVIYSTNPVESVLFLILTFCNASAILFLFNLDFFALIFIIIYVGAIAVLFLFVIMMLNIKIQNTIFQTFKLKQIFFFLISGFSIYMFLLKIYLNCKNIMFNILNDIETSTNMFSFLAIDNFSNIEILSQVFYNYYIIYLPLAGFLLLIALIGVIVLTLRFKDVYKKQFEFRQLSRTDNFLTLFDIQNN